MDKFPEEERKQMLAVIKGVLQLASRLADTSLGPPRDEADEKILWASKEAGPLHTIQTLVETVYEQCTIVAKGDYGKPND